MSTEKKIMSKEEIKEAAQAIIESEPKEGDDKKMIVAYKGEYISEIGEYVFNNIWWESIPGQAFSDDRQHIFACGVLGKMRDSEYFEKWLEAATLSECEDPVEMHEVIVVEPKSAFRPIVIEILI
jgi:hypothetical protein